MPEMKTLNGYEVVDVKARQTIADLPKRYQHSLEIYIGYRVLAESGATYIDYLGVTTTFVNNNPNPYKTHEALAEYLYSNSDVDNHLYYFITCTGNYHVGKLDKDSLTYAIESRDGVNLSYRYLSKYDTEDRVTFSDSTKLEYEDIIDIVAVID